MIFTSNQPRHVALVEACQRAGHSVLAVVEPKSIRVPEGVLGTYWRQVREAERQVFGEFRLMPTLVMGVSSGEASLAPVVQGTDRILVFGASWIRPPLVDHPLMSEALNLHAGIAPEYRGAACNFWAEYDGHPECVGVQVQRLGRGLDTGEVLAEVRAPEGEAFLRGMQAVRLGIEAMVALLDEPHPVPVDMAGRSAIRYSRAVEFTEPVVSEYLARLAVLA